MRQHFAMIQQWQLGVQRFKESKKREEDARLAENAKVSLCLYRFNQHILLHSRRV